MKLRCGYRKKQHCNRADLDSLSWSMRHLNQIEDPSARKLVIMSKWERGELSASDADRLIQELGLVDA